MENTVFVDIFNELLEENDLNRKQFAEKSGIPYTTVIGWTNMNRLPDYSALIKIADYFHCSIDYLVGRQDEFGNILYLENDLRPELTFIKYFRKLDTKNKELVIEITKNLSKNGN